MNVAPTEATLREVVEALAPMHRPAGSPGEQQAAEWIAERLRGAGCAAEVQEAEFLDGYARVMSPLAAASLAAGHLAWPARATGSRRRRAAGLAAAALTGLIADDISNGPRLFRRAAAPAPHDSERRRHLRGHRRRAHAGGARPPRRRPHRGDLR